MPDTLNWAQVRGGTTPLFPVYIHKQEKKTKEKNCFLRNRNVNVTGPWTDPITSAQNLLNSPNSDYSSIRIIFFNILSGPYNPNVYVCVRVGICVRVCMWIQKQSRFQIYRLWIAIIELHHATRSV